MIAKETIRTFVLGVEMTKFSKLSGKIDFIELGYEAEIKTMLDAHITYDDVDQGIACYCYCYGDSTCDQRGCISGVRSLPQRPTRIEISSNRDS